MADSVIKVIALLSILKIKQYIKKKYRIFNV